MGEAPPRAMRLRRKRCTRQAGIGYQEIVADHITPSELIALGGEVGSLKIGILTPEFRNL